MILIEDRELEAAVLARNSCLAVPVEIWKPVAGEAQITVYSCFEKIAREFEQKFSGCMFEADALNWLDEQLSATVKEFGYMHCFEDVHFLSEYYMTDMSQLQKSSNSADVKIIDNEEGLADVDTELISDVVVDSKAAVVIRDGKLVCISTANDVTFEDNSIELYVETHNDHRGKGYGTAAVKALAELYLKQGLTVRYKCAKTNLPSIALAYKCGFIKTGEKYAYVCYAIDEN